VAPTDNTAFSIVSCWVIAAEIYLPHRCVATSSALTTENTALPFLRAFASAGIRLPSHCLAMNYSGSQTSCDNIIRRVRLAWQIWLFNDAIRIEASIMERLMNVDQLVKWKLVGEKGSTRRKPVPVPLCPPLIPRELTDPVPTAWVRYRRARRVARIRTKKNTYNMSGKPEGKRPLWKPRHRWVGKSKTGLKIIVMFRGDYRRGFGLDHCIYCTLYIHTTRDYRQYSAIADLHPLQFIVTHALGFSDFTSHILATDI
jgi:hypothetical protein